MLKDQEFIRIFTFRVPCCNVYRTLLTSLILQLQLYWWTIGLFLYLRFYLMALFWCPNKRRTSPGCSTVEINTWARLLEQHAYEVEFPIWTRIKLDPHLNSRREWKPSLPVYWVYKKKTLVQCSLLSLSVKRIRKTESRDSVLTRQTIAKKYQRAFPKSGEKQKTFSFLPVYWCSRTLFNAG